MIIKYINTLLILGIFVLLPFYILFKGGEPLWQIYQSDTNIFQLILSLRLNAGITAIVCGAGLAVCGLFLQTLFQNPLSSPYTLGVSSVSSMFVSFFILLGYLLPDKLLNNGFAVLCCQLSFSLIGALLSLYIIFKIQRRTTSNALIVLVGILIGTFASSVSQILEFFMSPEQIKINFLWNQGNFELYDNFWVIGLVGIVSLCLFIYFRLTRDSDLYLLGHIYAQNMGLDIHKYQRSVFLVSAVLIATITALCGPIGFIGLVSAHVAKMSLKVNQHRRLFWSTLLIGANYALVCLIISHIGLQATQLPVNVISAIIGVPFTLYLMLKFFRT